RAVGVAPDAFQKVLIAIFYEVPIAKEAAVGLHAHRHHKMIRRSGVMVRSIRKHVSHVGLVWVGGQQIDVIDPFSVRAVEEVMVGVEVDIVTLLWEARAGLAMA